MKKNVVILRGISGSGKTTFANFLKTLCPDAVIASADDFFMENGEYKFHYTKINDAHNYCREKFVNALAAERPLVICANTNISENHFQFYIDKAKEFDYNYFVLILENRHNGKNIHGVPPESLEKQKINLINSLKLNI